MILIQNSNNIKIIGIYNAIKKLYKDIKIIKDIDSMYTAAKKTNPKKILFYIDNQSNVKKILNTISAIKSENQDIETTVFATEQFDGIDKFIDLNTIPYLTDIPLYGNGEEREYFKSDIILLSDDIDTDNYDNFIFIKLLTNKYNVKIFGDHKVPFVEYLGSIERDEYKNLFASAKYLVLLNSGHYINQAAINNCLPVIYGKDFDNKQTLLNFLENDNSELRKNAKTTAALNSYLRYVKENLL